MKDLEYVSINKLLTYLSVLQPHPLHSRESSTTTVAEQTTAIQGHKGRREGVEKQSLILLHFVSLSFLQQQKFLALKTPQLTPARFSILPAYPSVWGRVNKLLAEYSPKRAAKATQFLEEKSRE